MTKTKEVTYPVLPLHVFAQSEEENWFHVHIKLYILSVMITVSTAYENKPRVFTLIVHS